MRPRPTDRLGSLFGTVVLELLLVLVLVVGASAEAQARTLGAGSTGSTGAATQLSKGLGQDAPGGPPLVSASGEGGGQGGGADEAGSEEATQESDPLVENGLGSPLCEAPATELPPLAVNNCRTADFVAAQSPTGNYAFDVNIDAGFLGLSVGGFADVTQDVFVTPAWMALVWVIHALLVALEWCFTLDLLRNGAISAVGRGLREARAAFTGPWLVLALAIASVLAAYHGLVRRRVAQTTGEVALMLAMVLGGLWVISNPAGTVGALAEWADRASLGAFGAISAGSTSGSLGSLANGLAEVFAVTVEPAWCYMEFGNVGWCDDRARLDPQLRAAGLRIAAQLESEGSAEGHERSAELLRAARTNGQLFLALPANGRWRNSATESGSLFATLCGSAVANACRGPTAAQAEFRSTGATIPRLIGLFLIWAGALGAILTLGFLALRLLEAAIMMLLYLAMAPAAVLAPGLGDGGRSAFRAWVTKLLGAALSKLLFAFLLGALLLVVRLLSELDGFGWWIQWLLMAVLWWGAFRHRHRLLGFALLARASGAHRHRPLTGRVADAVVAPVALGRVANRAYGAASRARADLQLFREARVEARQRRQGTAKDLDGGLSGALLAPGVGSGEGHADELFAGSPAQADDRDGRSSFH